MYFVGWLDCNFIGVFLFINDGELILWLIYFCYYLLKIYDVWLEGNFSDEDLEKWRLGMMLDGKKILLVILEVIFENKD